MDSRPTAGRRSSPRTDAARPITTSSMTSAGSSVPVARSCHSCYRKKIRCDKRRPACSSCARSGEPCSYPALGPRVRRSKKTMMAEMASRISSLEKSLAQATADAKTEEGEYNAGDQAGGGRRRRRRPVSTRTPLLDPADRAPTPSPLPGPPTTDTLVNHSDSGGETSRQDILVQKGSSSQYFNEILVSRVIEEERNIESALTTPVTTSPSYPAATSSSFLSPFNAQGILSSPSPSQPVSNFHPPKAVAVKLWTDYVQNVEGCSVLKILHLPTDEVRVYSTIDDPAAASLENLALCLAIYFASAVTLDDDEATRATLGQDKRTYLLCFKVGLEQAFAQGDFLDRPTLTGLNALAIYLSALRVQNHGKGIWILNGLAIRIAQSLGLHRDGERLGLSPFQSEIRRRLWWHFLSRDGRAGEDYGLESAKGLSLVSDVGLPLNVDDADLHPDMKQLPAPRKGWTLMTFSLINIDLAKCMQKLAAAAVTTTPSTSPSTSSLPTSTAPSEEGRVQIIGETRATIEERLEHLNPVIPQHRLTLLCARFLLRKLDFVTRQQWFLLHQQRGPGQLRREDFATDENLAEALEILRPQLASEDGLLAQFAWARKAYPQYHLAMYVLWHLCVKPEGPHVQSAWDAIDTFFSRELWDEANQGFGSKSAVLVALRTKAVAAREKVQSRNLDRREAAGEPGNGDGDSYRRQEAGDADALSPTHGGGNAISTSLLGDMGGNEDLLDFDMGAADEWLDWGSFLQGT